MKIAFVSLGCDKNLVDSEIMLGIIDEEGHTITDDEKNSDIVIINTCGFIEEAVSEAIETILEFAELKKQGFIKQIIVTGCMAQRFKGEVFKEIPEVDAVIGSGDFDAIGKVIKGVSDGEKIILTEGINKKLDNNLAYKRMPATPSYIAYLKIAEGCDNHCTYCTIPSLRGKYRSRPLESLLHEANILVSKGAAEIVLVAQDTSMYGEDLYGVNKLHLLLQGLSEIEGLKWIRVMYCYPEHITVESINEIASNSKVCKYLDIPIQHASDKILKLMNRGASKQKIIDVIENLRHQIKGVSLRTTLIVGFPGETEDDFNELVQFVEKIKFDKLGAFAYSKEDGTPAAKLPNQVDEKEKQKRKRMILETQKIISAGINKKHIGETYDVIVDGKLPEEGMYCGRAYTDAYNTDGAVFFEYGYELLSGAFVKVKITNALDYDTVGVVIDEFTE
ncbi:MAG: 30S ribosomal protein S12 methylthiotransferase RimO [Clostridiales bacterium]|jgi:ribosomal protein S12 methylthiotransferase|nr:30S ribosomal protein S12 methylthiotransferase RimO [Clostridiales bacterium]